MLRDYITIFHLHFSTFLESMHSSFILVSQLGSWCKVRSNELSYIVQQDKGSQEQNLIYFSEQISIEQGSILLVFLSAALPFPKSYVSKKTEVWCICFYYCHFSAHQWMQAAMLSDHSGLLFQMQKKKMTIGSKSMNLNDLRLSCRLMEGFILFPRIYVFVFS